MHNVSGACRPVRYRLGGHVTARLDGPADSRLPGRCSLRCLPMSWLVSLSRGPSSVTYMPRGCAQFRGALVDAIGRQIRSSQPRVAIKPASHVAFLQFRMASDHAVGLVGARGGCERIQRLIRARRNAGPFQWARRHTSRMRRGVISGRSSFSPCASFVILWPLRRNSCCAVGPSPRSSMDRTSAS